MTRSGDVRRFQRALESLAIQLQPIVCWPEQRVVGQEALVRTPAFPRPGALFAAAERLGRGQVLALAREIRALVASAASTQPPEVRLFVNLHPDELWDDELFSPACPLWPLRRRVVLELSERAPFPEERRARWRMGGLRSLGYGLAMDDFGAGHAELRTLAELRPDVVKLDRSLVRDEVGSDRLATALPAIVGMCRELDATLVAEGIETVTERDRAVAAGCALLQGFYLGRPAWPQRPSLPA